MSDKKSEIGDLREDEEIDWAKKFDEVDKEEKKHTPLLIDLGKINKELDWKTVSKLLSDSKEKLLDLDAQVKFEESKLRRYEEDMKKLFGTDDTGDAEVFLVNLRKLQISIVFDYYIKDKIQLGQVISILQIFQDYKKVSLKLKGYVKEGKVTLRNMFEAIGEKY
jgi:hypothetical protein